MPSDKLAKKYPISIKGIVIVNDKIILLKNERYEWELPGGKIEENETAESCVIREISEELSIDATVNSIVDVWLYDILGKVKVLIVTFYCNKLFFDLNKIKISHEHKEVGMFNYDEISQLNMPQGYKDSIYKIQTKIQNG